MASNKQHNYYQGVGRRKSSVATVRLYRFGKKETIQLKNISLKKNDFLVNNKPIKEYFKLDGIYEKVIVPMELTDTKEDYAVVSFTRGGGRTGQAEALRLALSKSLVDMNEEFKSRLKKQGLMTRDSRIRERRKVGTGGKARRKKQSPKR